MYMYYFLTQKLLKKVDEEIKEQKELTDPNEEEKRKVETLEQKKLNKMNNTFILALDGDVDFKPPALLLLIDRMKRNVNVGAACGRIHPIGVGKTFTTID